MYSWKTSRRSILSSASYAGSPSSFVTAFLQGVSTWRDASHEGQRGDRFGDT